MLFEQDLLPPPLSKTEIPLQTDAAQNTEVPFPLTPSQEAVFPEGAGHQHFSACSKLPVTEALLWASKAAR